MSDKGSAREIAVRIRAGTFTIFRQLSQILDQPIAERMERAIEFSLLSDRPNWRRRLRTHVVSRGVHVMCGSADYVSADYASDIPLLSGAARLPWLKALATFGIKSFITTSGLGYDFVCHTGDLANFSIL